MKKTEIAFVQGNIKEARTIRGLSQSELASLIGCSKNIVTMWETGRVSPSVSSLLNIINTLNFPISFFFMDARTKKSPTQGD